MELLVHQTEPYRRLKQAALEQVRLLMVMATGLGKTHIAAHFTKNELIAHGRGLFLCHDIDILQQNLAVFREVLGEKYSFGIFYGEQKDFEQVDILFATFQTFHTWKHAFFADEFSFVLVDEAHHSEANTFKPVIEYFTPRTLLGMTATPHRADDRDIRETFGDAVVEVNLEEGIANGWLTKVDYHLLSDHLSKRAVNEMLAQLQGGGTKVSIKQLNQTVFIERRDEEIVRKILEYGDRAIVFCATVQHANRMAEKLPNAATLHSENSSYENKRALREFKSKKLNFLVAVDKLNEGIDIPHVELIVFLRATDSLRIFLQQLGRGLRTLEGKEKVTVLDFVGNCDRVAIVQQLVDRIKDYSMQGQVEYDKGPFFIPGDGFTFAFDDTMRELQDILFLLRQKRYVSEIPHLAAEYSPKNELPASEVIVGTHKKVLWKCQIGACGHEWKAEVQSRVVGRGCPLCANMVTSDQNCMSTTHPQLAKEFHPTRNAPLTPGNVIAGTHRKIWWKCQVLTCGHEWKAGGGDRVKGRGCPLCANMATSDQNCMSTTHPQLAKEFHPTRNAPLTPGNVIAGTHRKIWWKCQVLTCGHEWKTSGCHRTQKSGCPRCSKLRSWIIRRQKKQSVSAMNLMATSEAEK